MIRSLLDIQKILDFSEVKTVTSGFKKKPTKTPQITQSFWVVFVHINLTYKSSIQTYYCHYLLLEKSRISFSLKFTFLRWIWPIFCFQKEMCMLLFSDMVVHLFSKFTFGRYGDAPLNFLSSLFPFWLECFQIWIWTLRDNNAIR